MDNGIYNRMEIKLVVYENSELNNDDIFVVFTTDTHEDEPIVIHGDVAREMIMTLMNNVDKVIGVEGS